MNTLLIAQLVVFSFTLWFGVYLIARDFQKPGLRFTGLGLISYAIGLAVAALSPLIWADTVIPPQWRLTPVLLPSIFWMAATWHLLPDSTLPHIAWLNSSRVVSLIGVGISALVFIALQPVITHVIVAGLPLAFLGMALIKVRQAFRSVLPQSPLVVVATATLFFLLGTTLLIVPLEVIASEWMLLAISFDLMLLGVAMGVLDAHEEGTILFADAIRSLLASGFSAVIFGGQVGILIAVSAPQYRSPSLVVLLFTVVGTAIGFETLSRSVQSALDRLVFADRPKIQEERQLLRTVNNALPRINADFDVNRLSADEFARLTRRALSHLNDLDKLAASPLTQLPVITARLTQQGKTDSVLERAHELKNLLGESILHLKPYSDKDFEPSDAWRYYNVLYFPYVLGLKPYSVRMSDFEADMAAREALEWFQTHVPERTLYNWQTTGARLIAQHLHAMQTEGERVQRS